MNTAHPAPGGTPPVLDRLDRRLLVALDRSPTASFQRLAEEAGTSARTAARRFRELRASGAVRVVGRTSPRFGGQEAWLARAQGDPATVAELARTLAAHRSTRWVRISRDGAELMCGLVTRTPDAAVLRTLPRDSRLRSVSTHELFEVWTRTRGAVSGTARELDAVDRGILGILAQDGRTDARRIADRLGVDPSTVIRRRQRLVEAGVLFFEADIHPAALGGTGDAMLWLQAAPGSIRELGAWLRDQPECRFAAACSGTSNLVAHLLMPDVGELLAFLDGPLAGRGVVSYETVRMGTVLKRLPV